MRDSRTKKYVVRSTKETSRIKARLAAEEIAAEIRSSVKRVERAYTFEAYGKRLLQKANRMVANGERHARFGASSLPMIGALLGHTQVQTTARYAHLASAPVKGAADAITEVLAQVLAN